MIADPCGSGSTGLIPDIFPYGKVDKYFEDKAQRNLTPRKHNDMQNGLRWAYRVPRFF